MRLGNRRWLLWWVPAVALAICAFCLPADSPPFFTFGGWPEIFVALTLLYMIGVAVARGFVARQPPPEPPRGFEVILKAPPSGPNENPNAPA
jgi:hypothetical protein